MKSMKEQVTLFTLKMLLSNLKNTLKLSVMIKGQKNTHVVKNVSAQHWDDEMLIIFESDEKIEYCKPLQVIKHSNITLEGE